MDETPVPVKKKRVYDPKDPKGYLDVIVGKIISKKFMVFAVATALLLNKTIGEEWWGYLCCAYVGIEGFVDVVARLRSAK